MKRLVSWGLLVTLLASAGVSVAESQANEETRMEAGTILEMDLAGRKAIIGGYEYVFTRANGYDLPKVTMLGSSFGAFEMLQVGMKAKITYVPSDDVRIVVELNQLADNTEIGDGGFLFLSEGDDDID